MHFLPDVLSGLPAAVRSRFAPTPSGFLHLGNAFSFVLTWLVAQVGRGTIFLRIDDLDTARFRPEYLQDIFFSLEWLGLSYDRGPCSPDDHSRNFSQKWRTAHYRSFLQQLVKNRHAFFCRCSRKEIAENCADSQHPPACRLRKTPFAQGKTALRLLTPAGELTTVPDLATPHTFALYTQMRDFVIMRKDGLPAYQIASLADDLTFGINTIVRGEDLWLSSAAQVFLAAQLGETAFLGSKFLHHSLFYDENGKKYAKSAGSSSLKYLRESGVSPRKVYAQIAKKLNFPKNTGESANTLLKHLQSYF